MQLQGALLGVEHSPEMMTHLAGDVFDGNVGHQVEVNLGTDRGEPRCQDLGALVRGSLREIVRQRCVGEVGEVGEIAQRGVGEASPDHARLDVRVEPHCYGSLDATADDHQVIDEAISGPAPGIHLLTEALLLCGRHGLDDKDLEIGTAEGIVLRGAHDEVLAVVAMFTLGDVAEETRSVGLGDERAIDASHQPAQPFPSSGRRELLDEAEGGMARERPELLQRRQCRALHMHGVGDVAADRLPASQGGDDPPRRLLQPRPGVCPELPPAVVRVRAGLIAHDQLLELEPRAATQRH